MTLIAPRAAGPRRRFSASYCANGSTMPPLDPPFFAGLLRDLLFFFFEDFRAGAPAFAASFSESSGVTVGVVGASEETIGAGV